LNTNSPSPATSVPGKSLGDQLKLAWLAHTSKDNDQALRLFQSITEQDPTHIDAAFGFGLTLIRAGQYERADQVFTRAAELVAVRISQQAADDEDSRYTMLARMIAQQLDGLKTRLG